MNNSTKTPKGNSVAKKDKSEKKLKDKSKKASKKTSLVAESHEEANSHEEATPELVEETVVEATKDVDEVLEDLDSDGENSAVESLEKEKPVKKAPVKRSTKKVEIPATSLELITDFPLEDIIPREGKTRFRAKETEAVLTEMIQRFGWTEPLTLDAEHRIVDGQYRYELAQKWKLETVPVIITDSVNATDGTTDLYHMLSGRIIEWDKWNFPATNEILKSLDGGLGTETILGFETVSEDGDLRDLARKVGWFIEVIPKSLSGSTVTLETLAGLLKKSLAGKYHYDPAQLLYIEALREQLETVRREMVANGEVAGGVKPKLEQHIAEEENKQKLGNKIAEENNYEMEISEDGKVATFSAEPELNYIVNKVAIAEEAARVQVKSAKDMASRFRPMADGKKLGLTQFNILATYFTDMTTQDASDFFNSTSPDAFNAFVDQVLEENRTISADRSKNFPMTDAELKAEQYRLRGEDIRKETERAKGNKPAGLQALKVDDLKALLKTEGLKLTGKKDELIARLEEAGYNGDGVKVTPNADVEEAMRSTPESVEVGDVRDIETAELDSEISNDEELETVSLSDIENNESMALYRETAMSERTIEDSSVDELTEDDQSNIIENEAEESEEESDSKDLKTLKKRRKELKKIADNRELTKAELKELKALKKELKS